MIARTCIATTLCLAFSGCFNGDSIRSSGVRPPKRPPAIQPSDPIPAIPDANAELGMPEKIGQSTTQETEDFHLSIIPGPIAINVRKNPPRFGLLTDRAIVRIDLPVGYAGHPTGLAELTADVVSSGIDSAGNQKSLREVITGLGGHLEVRVAALWTSFTVTVPVVCWQEALRILAERVQEQRITQEQFAEVRAGWIRRRLGSWLATPLRSRVKQWVQHGERTRDTILQEFEDRNLPEVILFQRRHYQPRRVAVGLWIPNAPKDPSFVIERARQALVAWRTQPTPSGSGAKVTPASPPSGVLWMETKPPAPGPKPKTGGTKPAQVERSQIALIFPLAPVTPARWTLMECLSRGGIDGRLGQNIRRRLDGFEPVFRYREIGSYDHRYMVLEGSVPTKKVPDVWTAAQLSWRSLTSNPPIGRELAEALQRARLRLLVRQDQPGKWFEATGLRLLRQQAGGPNQDLRKVAGDSLDINETARQLRNSEIAMVVHGGQVPAEKNKSFRTVETSVPRWHQPATQDLKTSTANAKPFLELALRALGEKRIFKRFVGYKSDELWEDKAGIQVKVKTEYRGPKKLEREMETMGKTIEINVEGTTGTEKLGKRRQQLGAEMAANHLAEAARHPLALLAEWQQSGTVYRYIGLRRRYEREVALLERVDPTRHRLRLTIDTQSGLVRTVETTLRRADIGLVQVKEYYDDYRRVDGLRTPHHKVTMTDNANDGVESVYRSFRTILR